MLRPMGGPLLPPLKSATEHDNNTTEGKIIDDFTDEYVD